MIEVVVGVLIERGKVLIAKRASHKSMPGKWEFPGGKINTNEDPKTALERELFEEFGVKTKTGEHLVTTEHDYAEFKIKLISYLSTYIEGEYTLIDHEKIEWVRAEQLLGYDMTEADMPIVEKLILNLRRRI